MHHAQALTTRQCSPIVPQTATRENGFDTRLDILHLVKIYRLEMLLPPQHHNSVMRQRLCARGADIEALFFTVVEFPEIEMQITDSAARDITLAGNLSISLKDTMQRIDEWTNVTPYIPALWDGHGFVRTLLLVTPDN